MQQDTEKIPIFYKESAISSAILLGGAAAALMGWFAWSSWLQPVKTMDSLFGMICGPLMAFLCLALMIGAIRLVVTKQAAFELTRDGVTYTPIMGKTKRYSWDRIGSVTIREQPVYRNKPQTMLEVVSRGESPKTLIRVEAKSLDLSIADMTGLIEAFAQAHAGGTSEFAVHDRRPVTRTTSPVIGFGSWVLGLIIITGISTGGRIACHKADEAIVNMQPDARANRELARFDAVADTAPFMQSIKKAHPKEYESLRQSLRQGLHNNLTQEELEAKVAEFMDKLRQRHLMYATPAVLKRYMQARYNLYEDLYSISSDALYVSLSTGKINIKQLNVRDQEKVRILQQKLVSGDAYGLGDIFTAPESDKPLPQNKELAQSRLVQISQNLTDEEHTAFDNEGKPGLDHVAYCKAALHLYRECLTLPDKEMVQVFRALQELPEDDRLVAE